MIIMYHMLYRTSYSLFSRTSLIAIIIIIFFVSSCGNKGPLTIPEEPENSEINNEMPSSGNNY
jgi:predicted small lipoprotein YifL